MPKTTSVAALMTKEDVCAQLQVSERTIENMVKAGEFPPPVRIGKRVYWTHFTIQRWQEELFTAQESWSLY